MSDEPGGRDRHLTRIPAVVMRGGTSKGVFLHAEHLPPMGPERDDVILRIMGTPDPMQIDGLGGTYSSTSKVIVVEPRASDSVVYWFAQVGIEQPVVDWSGNCGNLTSAVGPFSIDEGLVDAVEPLTRLRLINGNTGVTVEAEVQVSGGRAVTVGDQAIFGVPGTGAPVVTRYLDPAGGVLGSALPTGSATDIVEIGDEEIEVSIVDVTHPYAFVGAASLGLVGDTRTPAQLNADGVLLSRAEEIRGACAVLVGRSPSSQLAATASPIVPRLVIVQSDPAADIRALSISMGRVHRAIPMTAALCIGAASHMPGTIVERALAGRTVDEAVRIAHPLGTASVVVDLGSGDQGIRSVGVVRTARRLMDGWVYPREY